MKGTGIHAVLGSHKRILPARITERITDSFADVDQVLGRLPELNGGLALDVGCGCALASFALAERFDRVIGIDTDPRWIHAARYLTARAGVSNLSFELADAETLNGIDEADFIFCNLMSHYGQSRIALLRRLRDVSSTAGWMFYSEETEGYGLMELARAVTERDARCVRKQVRRLLNAVLGNPGSREEAQVSCHPRFAGRSSNFTVRPLNRWRHGHSCY